MPGREPIDRADSRLILIGTAAYKDPGFPAVPTAAESLLHMRHILTDPLLGGWPDDADQVKEFINPSDCRRVVTEIRALAKSTTGTLLLYFVGHGTLHAQGRSHPRPDRHRGRQPRRDRT